MKNTLLYVYFFKTFNRFFVVILFTLAIAINVDLLRANPANFIVE